MSKPMFGWKWGDGTWRNAPEPKPLSLFARPQPPPRKPWVKKTGFFKDGREAPAQAAHIRNNRAYLYRTWLEHTFTKPTPARIVFELAKRHGFALRGVCRARVRLGVKTIKAGGKGSGQRNPWVWLFPAESAPK